MRVLDFGCGTGLLSFSLRPLVGSLVGLDTSAGMLAEFEAKLAASGFDGMRTVCGGFDSAALEPGFDLIVSSMALHHVEDTAALLAGFYRLLKPGGRIALADLDLDGGRFHEDATGVFHNGFERKALAQLITTARFAAVEVVTATQLRKPVQGEPRDFSVFLACGRKPL